MVSLRAGPRPFLQNTLDMADDMMSTAMMISYADARDTLSYAPRPDDRAKLFSRCSARCRHFKAVEKKNAVIIIITPPATPPPKMPRARHAARAIEKLGGSLAFLDIRRTNRAH